MRRTLFVLVALCAAIGVTFVTTNFFVDQIDVPQPPAVIVEAPVEPVHVVTLQRPIEAGTKINARLDIAVALWPSDASSDVLVVPKDQPLAQFINQYDGLYAQVDLLPGQPLATGLIGFNPPPGQDTAGVLDAAHEEPPVWEPGPDGPATSPEYEHPVLRSDVALISVEEAGELYLGGIRQVDLYRLQATAHGKLHRLVPVVLAKTLERVEGPTVPRGLSYYVEDMTAEQQAALALTRADGCLHIAPSGAASAGINSTIIATQAGRFVDQPCQPLEGDGNELLRLEDYDTQRDPSLQKG